jgi:transcriptional regulator with XRE-family HTH domain
MKVTIDGIEYAPVLPFYSGDKRTLSVLLADIRKVLGWTLAQAGVHIGCSVGGLHALECADRMPSLKMAAKISRAYGVPIHILAAATLNEES